MRFISRNQKNLRKLIRKRWVLTGALLGLLFSIALYGFGVIFREVFRIVSFLMQGNLLILNSGEIFFYDFIYGCFASVIAFSFSLKFMVENSIERHNVFIRNRQRSIINDHNFFTWNTLSWLGRLFMLMGIWYLMFPMYYEVDFYAEYKFLFILLILVWYFCIWLTISRSIGREVFKWMSIVAGIIVLNSLLLTRLNLVNYTSLNESLLSQTIDYYYKVEYPESLIQTRTYRMSLVSDLFIGFSKKDSTGIPVIFTDNSIKISLEDIKLFISQERDKVNSIERDLLSVILHIDRDVPMFFVERVLQELRKQNVQIVYFSTVPKNSSYPNHYPGFKPFGIQSFIGDDCSRVINQVDSLMDLGYSSKQVRFPDLPCYRTATFIKSLNRVMITVKKDEEFLLNNTSIEKTSLADFLHKFIRKYKDQSLVMIRPDESSTYNDYISVLDLTYSEILNIRKEEATNRYSLKYKFDQPPWDKPDEIINLENEYPLHIMTFTEADRALYDYTNN